MAVLALITTFFPDIEVVQTIENIKKQVDLVLIVDNGSGWQNLRFLEQYQTDERVKIVMKEQNMGIAWSCNFAAKFALENGFEWLLTLDDDSLLDQNYVSQMLEINEKICEKYSKKQKNELKENTNTNSSNSTAINSKLGLICPTYFYDSTAVLAKQNQTESDFCQIQSGMSSGSFINRRVFEKGIFFEEKFFVDYFDLEFYMAVQNGGFEIFEASKIVLNHKLGNICKKTILGKTFIPTNYSPFRRYYQARNRIVLYWRYWRKFPKFCLQDMRNSLMDIVKMYLAEDNKIKKTKAILLGTFHGIIGKFQNPAPNFD